MTLVEQLAYFSSSVVFDDLPADVVDECKRLTLDALGCSASGHGTLKGRAGVEFGHLLGGSSQEVAIVGCSRRSSVFGAAFANGELINALDFDPILPPGHVTPFTLPAALALGEAEHVDGKSLIAAIAVAHEMSYRFGQAMDSLREIIDGVAAMPAIFGYSSTVFGATAAAGRMLRLPEDVLVEALSIAGLTAPTNTFRPWAMHTPPTTIKYLSAGVLAQTSLTAAHLARLGHRGDHELLDDREYGFPRFIGTDRWEPEHLTDQLGTRWLFPTQLSYRPYPHARSTHTALDAVTEIVTSKNLQPHEIEAVRAWGEPFAATYPAWQNRTLVNTQDALYSTAYALAMSALRIPAGRAWQTDELVFGSAVEDLAQRSSFYAHPDYVASVTADPASRPTRVEIDARGTTYIDERLYPKGSPSPDPRTSMSTSELVSKFRSNTDRLLVADAIDDAIQAILTLEDATDISVVMELFTQVTEAKQG